MISYQYTYLIGSLIALTIWTFFFIHRKDTRREMLTLSIIFGITGILAEYLYTIDWWKPLTITGTRIGIEDFLFGFSCGGVFGVAYEYFFKKKIKIKRQKNENKRILAFFFSIFIAILTFLSIFVLFDLNSFVLTILIFSTGIAIMLIKRHDLVKDSIYSGIIALVISIIVYQIVWYLTPGFFNKFWLYENIGKITFLRIPLEEIIWFFLAGAFIGPFWEYWKKGKIINFKRKK